MFDPWSFLDLDPQHATEKDVRSAYARLLKKYRPDQDQEGFQRLRQAYEAALEEIRNRDEAGESEVLRIEGFSAQDLQEKLEKPSDVEPREEPLTSTALDPQWASLGFFAPPVPSDWPETVREALAELIEAVNGGSLKKARDSFQKSWRAFQKAGVSVRDRAQFWLGVTRFAPSELAPMVSSEALVEQWRGNEWELTHWLMANDLECFPISDIKKLSRRLAKHRSTISHFEAALVALQLAEAVAVDLPQTTRVLLNAAYPHLSAGERKIAFLSAEARERIGALVVLIPWWRRRYWLSVFRDENATVNWKKWRNRHRLKKLTQWMPESWEGWSSLEQRMPENLWRKTQNQLAWERWWQRRLRIIQLFRPRHLANLLLVFLGVMFLCFLMALPTMHPDPIIHVVIHPHRQYPPLPPTNPPKPEPKRHALPASPKP